MKVLIADDELNICKLIKNLLDWDSLGLELLGFAHNGCESSDMIKTYNPEIVITDIRMPGKSGLDIIKDCMEQGLGIQFIIISGHAEFEYARQAIKYGVSDFLLKPINQDELNEALGRIVKRLSNFDKKSQVTKETHEINRAVLRNSLLMSLYHRDFDIKDNSIETLNNTLSFHFKKGLFLPVVIKLLSIDNQTCHANNILNQMKSVLEKELQTISEDFCVCEKGYSLLCIFNFPEYKINDFQITLQYSFDILLNIIAPYNFYKIVIGTGAPVQILKQLQESFLQAVCASDSHLCLGGNRIINGAGMDIRLLNSSLITVEEPNRLFKPFIELPDAECLRETLCKEFRRQMPDISLYPYSINTYIHKFTAAILRDISGIHKIQELQDTIESILAEVLKCQSLEQAEKILADQIYKILDKLQANSPDHKTVKTVKNYIEHNFNQQIRLEDAAQTVYLSPAYLGILFKRETGQNFSDYVTAVRMEKAKEMLRDNRYNINEVAKRVGYKDTRYFSKLFNSTVGIKPTQYRQMFARGGVDRV